MLRNAYATDRLLYRKAFCVRNGIPAARENWLLAAPSFDTETRARLDREFTIHEVPMDDWLVGRSARCESRIQTG